MTDPNDPNYPNYPNSPNSPNDTGRPAPVSVLGLGPMGRALAAAFLAAGHPTTVWNRTPGRAGTLPDRGAAVARTAEEAVSRGRVVVACLVDDDAVRAVLDPTGDVWDGRVLVNLTSSEPAEARAMADWAGTRGIRYLDGAILSPTPTIGTPAAVVLYSGDPAAHAATEPALAGIGGTASYLGPDPGRASGYDIALLDLFATSVHGIVHAFALAAAEGIEPEAFAPFATGIGGLLPEMIGRFAKQISADEYPGEFSTIASAGSSVRHIVAAAAAHGLDVGALTAMRAVIDRAVAEGHGADGLARLTTTLRR